MIDKNFRPVAISIAGFDPSGGAGVLADVKTFEANKVYGLAVNTCITVQNDRHFDSLKWLPEESVVESMTVLSKRYRVQAAKLGMHKSMKDVLFHVNLLNEFWPGIKIVWDPVLGSSSGFDLKIKVERVLLEKVMQRVTLITPNLPELERLRSGCEGSLPFSCSYLVKGGHGTGKGSADKLFVNGKLAEVFTGNRILNGEKHGSGCVLSAAITASLAKGNTLNASIANAKVYTRKFLSSNKTLSGYHIR